MASTAPIFVFMALAVAAAAPAAGSECAPTELLPESAGGARVTESSLRMRLIEPANGSAVDADSVVVVEVDYRVADFEPGKFGLMVSFPALVSQMSPHGPEGRYELSQAVGRVRLCVPLRPVYAVSGLRWPLSLSILLNKPMTNDSPRLTAVFQDLARSEVLTLNSVAPPGEAERMRREAVEPAYRDAVMALAGTIFQMRATGEVCPGLPDIEVEFSAAYRGWAARNAPVIERVLVLQRDLFERDIARPDIVDVVMQRLAKQEKAGLEALAPDELARYCQRYTRAFSNPRSDLETAGAAQLAVIHAQAPPISPSTK